MEEYVKNLICKVVDGTATIEEEKIMNELTDKNPEVQKEFAAQNNIAESFHSVGLPELDDSLRKKFV